MKTNLTLLQIMWIRASEIDYILNYAMASDEKEFERYLETEAWPCESEYYQFLQYLERIYWNFIDEHYKLTEVHNLDSDCFAALTQKLFDSVEGKEVRKELIEEIISLFLDINEYDKVRTWQVSQLDYLNKRLASLGEENVHD